MAHFITGFKGIKKCIQYIAIHPKKPIFYPSDSYDGSNTIRCTWSGTQVEELTTHNCLEYHQDADHARIINMIGSVSGIIHNILGLTVYRILQIELDVSYGTTYG